MSAIIFDFDGTIADSFDYVSNLIASKAGHSGLTLRQRQQKFAGLSDRGMMEELNKPVWWGLWLFFYGRRVMSRHMGEIGIFNGMDGVLKSLREQGHELFILSSNRNRNVRLFLDRYQLSQYFSQTQGNASVFGKSFALRWLLFRNRLRVQNCFYIGDETGDLESAGRLRIRSVAVTWGYNSPQALAAGKPFGMAETPQALLELLQ